MNNKKDLTAIIISRMIVIFFLGVFSASHAALIDNVDGTVTDDDTGLMWLKESFPRTGSAETAAKTWKQAMLWANSLNFAEHTDWRLPSALELTTGVPEVGYNPMNNEWGHLYGVEWSFPANQADIAPMSHYPCCGYWTSTEDPANSERAVMFRLTYDTDFNNTFYAKDTEARFTAVRGAAKPTKAPQCRDGYDNDSNGYVDYPNDEGCTNADDDGEYTCTGIIGLFTCNYLGQDYRYWCFKIDDSTICLERIFVIAGVIIVTGFGWWGFRRRKKSG